MICRFILDGNKKEKDSFIIDVPSAKSKEDIMLFMKRFVAEWAKLAIYNEATCNTTWQGVYNTLHTAYESLTGPSYLEFYRALFNVDENDDVVFRNHMPVKEDIAIHVKPYENVPFSIKVMLENIKWDTDEAETINKELPDKTTLTLTSNIILYTEQLADEYGVDVLYAHVGNITTT